MLRKLQEELKNTEKFYESFFQSKDGKSSLDFVYKNFYPIDKTFDDTSNLQLSIDFIIEQMQNWLFEKLTDDEMDSAYVWFESLEPELRNLIEDGLT